MSAKLFVFLGILLIVNTIVSGQESGELSIGKLEYRVDNIPEY